MGVLGPRAKHRAARTRDRISGKLQDCPSLFPEPFAAEDPDSSRQTGQVRRNGGRGQGAWGGIGTRRLVGHSLQHVVVELLLAVAQELSNHLPAEAFTLEQEMGHSDGGVRDEAARDQELDAFVGVSGGVDGGREE